MNSSNIQINRETEELFADLFAYRFALQDIYEDNEREIIIKLKLKIFELGYNRNNINNLIFTFYNYYNIPITEIEIENSNVMIYNYNNNNNIIANRLYTTILAVLDNMNDNNDENEDENHEVLTETEFEKLELINIVTNDNDIECSICIDKFEKGQEAIKLKCKHLFHKNCIKSHLLNYNKSCPLCREII